MSSGNQPHTCIYTRVCANTRSQSSLLSVCVCVPEQLSAHQLNFNALCLPWTASLCFIFQLRESCTNICNNLSTTFIIVFINFNTSPLLKMHIFNNLNMYAGKRTTLAVPCEVVHSHGCYHADNGNIHDDSVLVCSPY